MVSRALLCGCKDMVQCLLHLQVTLHRSVCYSKSVNVNKCTFKLIAMRLLGFSRRLSGFCYAAGFILNVFSMLQCSFYVKWKGYQGILIWFQGVVLQLSFWDVSRVHGCSVFYTFPCPDGSLPMFCYAHMF